MPYNIYYQISNIKYLITIIYYPIPSALPYSQPAYYHLPVYGYNA